ncbi:MAG: UvrD-helicase domain-containing protein [Pseudomonadota bacterium]
MPSDHAARLEALNPEASFIVQAPAGSGKTGLLVYRILTLLARVDQPQQVLAITFTRKATAEMRERLLQLIAKAESGETSDDPFEQQGIDLAWAVVERDKMLGWHLLDAPHQLQILTIDAFGARLTTSMPWLSRLGDRPRTTDNAERHYAAAVEQLLAELLQDDTRLSRALQVVMLEIDYDYNRARRLFTSMLARRDQWLRHLSSGELNLLRAALESAWQTVSSEQLANLSEHFSSDLLEELVTLGQFAQANLSSDPGEQNTTQPSLRALADFDKSVRFLNVEQWQALRFLLCGKGKTFRKRVDKRLGFPAGSAEKERLQEILSIIEDDDSMRSALLETDHIPRLQFSHEDWQQLLALEEVLRSLAGLLQLQFRAAGECDHAEVTQRANLALQELDAPTDLALRMDYQLQHILVDEFQDTSHGQIELLKRLTKGWSIEDTGPPKTLFLVGDPMQSIYRFREADVSLFLRVAQNARTRVFDNIDIQSLRLSENFRSNSALVGWFNDVFAASFPQQNNVLSGAIRYADSTSSRASASDSVRYYAAYDRDEEAAQVVTAVQDAIAALPDQRSRVALLVRSRGQLSNLLPALTEAGVAFQGVDIRPLQNQQAVVDLIALCKAICREDDRVSWLALLRGPWCGLILTELMALCGESSLSIWEQLSSHLSQMESGGDNSVLNQDSAQRLRRFMVTMQHAMQQRQQVDLSSLTRWAWQALGGQETLFGASPRDIDTVFKLIQNLQIGGDLVSVAELDQAVERLYAEPSGDPQARLVVSTMHKAKGLQYHTVILPGLSRPPGANTKEMMMWAEHQSNSGVSQLLLAPLRVQDEPGSHYHYLRELEKKRATNEAIRLMYVACTRAEHRLVLLGQLNEDQDSGAPRKPYSNTLLGTIWEAVESHFSFAESPLVTATDDSLADMPDQGLSRLPAAASIDLGDAVEWLTKTQLTTDVTEDETEAIEFEWSTEVATAIGVVMHNWLQFNQASVFDTELNDSLQQQWQSDLRSLGVAPAKIGYGIARLSSALTNMQQDDSARFLLRDYAEQHNEYELSCTEDGVVKTYRIDRTFVDENNTRWVVDYKTTTTRASDIDAFVDEQVQERHRAQLERYGELMSQIDSRPVKLVVYFPMLARMRSWDYQADS